MKTRSVDLGGPVHLADFGGEGAPVVLVHGLGGSHTNWMAVGGALAAKSRVLAPDLLGFGRTPLAGRAPSIEANVALLGRFLAEVVGEPATLVGNSMGALVSLLTAAAYPDRVSRLVLVGPALPLPPGAKVDPRVVFLFAMYMIPGAGELFVRRRMNQLGPEKMLRETLRICGVTPERMLPAAWEASLSLAHERRETMPWANQAYVGSARSLVLTNLRREKVYRTIAKIRAPGLLIQGSADRLVPVASTAEVARRRPDWRYEVLEGVGHVPQLEVPSRWVEIVMGWMGN